MASKTFDQLTELAAAPSSGDWFALVDETAGSTKKLDAKYLVATAGVVTNVTGGGTIALGGFTATIPATGTVALRNVANTFSAAQTMSFGSDLIFQPAASVSTHKITAHPSNIRAMRFEYDSANEAGGWEWYDASGDSTMMFLLKTGHLQIGTATDSGQLTVDQSESSGAIPVLVLDQGDADEDFIEFTGTVGTGKSIEAKAAKTLTTTHFLRMNITGVGYVYMQVGTIA